MGVDSPARLCGMDGCNKPLRARDMCSNHYNRSQYPSSERHPPRTVECAVCERPMQTTSSRTYKRNVCSYLCRWFLTNPDAETACVIPTSHAAHQRWVSPDSRLPVLWKPAPATVAPRPSRIRWVAGICRRCGAPFVDTWLAEASSTHCSAACSKALGKQRRRARERGAYVADVSPHAVFERDAWRCGLCRRKVRRNVKVPHPLAAVLDHIVPLAKGGTHEPGNVQCAHFRCNSVKSDRIGGGVQPALF